MADYPSLAEAYKRTTGSSVLSQSYKPPQEAVPTNPISYLGGLIGNIPENLGAMAQGVGSLLSAAGHDVTVGIENLIPGQQAAEKEGYRLDDILMALPGAFGSDIANRYGGASNIARGLYNDPLAYILDVIGLGAVAGAGARIGGKAGLLSDAAVQAVRGASLGSRPAYQAVELTGKGILSGAENLPLALSTNPVVRKLIQEPFYNKFLTVGPESSQAAAYAEKLGLQGGAAGIRAGTQLELAKAAGVPVLKPSVGRVVGSHIANKFLGISNKRFIDARDKAMTQLKEILGKELDEEGLLQILQHGGDAQIGLTAPANRAVPTFVTDLPEREGLPPITPQTADVSTMEKLVEKFGTSVDLDRWEHLPHRMGELDAGERYVIQTEYLTPEVASVILREAADSLGGDVVAVLNKMGTDDLWYGLHGAVTTADGKTIEISLTDPGLRAGQNMVDDIFGLRNELAAQLDEQTRLLHALTGEEEDFADQAARFQNEVIPALKNDIDAATRYAQEAMSAPVRLRNSDATGIPYDELLMKRDQLVPWLWEHGTKKWMQDDYPTAWLDMGLAGPFTAAMDRGLGPLRLEKLASDLASLRTQLGQIVRAHPNPDNAIGPGTLYSDLVYALEDFGLTEGEVERVLATRPIKGQTFELLDESVAHIVQSVKEHVRDRYIWNGDAVGYDWRTLVDEVDVLGKQLPIYYPHIRASNTKLSDFLWRGSRMASINSGEPVFSRHWMGVLYEHGAYSTDIAESYGRMASVYARHHEMIDFVSQVAEVFGREITPDELKVWKDAGRLAWGNGEMIWNPYGVSNSLKLNSHMVNEIFDMVNGGLDYDSAVATAWERMADRVLEHGLDNIGGGQVFAIPKHVADKVAQQAKLALGWKARMFYDGPINLWKASVLSFSPRWLINNFMGNTFFMGVRHPTAFARALTQMGKKNAHFASLVIERTDPALLRGIETGFFTTVGESVTNYGIAEGTLPARVAHGVMDTKVARGLSRWSTMIRNFNSKIEQAARRGVFITAAEKELGRNFLKSFGRTHDILSEIAGDGFSQRVKYAMGEVDKTLGNYTAMGPYERQIIRRFIMPFYPFYRHMTKFALRLPFDNPLKASLFMKLQQMDEEMYAELPEFMRQTVPLSQLGGETVYMRFNSWNPLQALGERSAGLSVLNPILRIFGERSFGVSSLTGKPFPILDGNQVQTHTGQGYRVIRDGDGRIIGVEQLQGNPLPSLQRHIGAQFPQLAILPQFQTYEKNPALSAASLVGAPLTQFNPTTYAYNRALQDMEAIQAAIRQDVQ